MSRRAFKPTWTHLPWTLSLLASACGDGGGTSPQPQTMEASPCADHGCEGHALCTLDAQSDPVCVCQPGYAGKVCDQCRTGFASVQGECHATLERSLPEPAGTHCEAGGVAVSSGADLNDSGALETSEVEGTRYICNTPATSTTPTNACKADSCGAHGTCVEGSSGGFTCTCDTGYHGALCDGCDNGWAVNAQTGVCTLVQTQTQPVEQSSAACPDGAYSVLEGTDTDGNGVLEGNEITATKVLCRVVRTGNFTFADLADLLDFSDVTDIVGDVTITSTRLTDLKPLASLLRIDGKLTIDSNRELTTLDGLKNLDTVTGALAVTNNGALTDLALGTRVVRGDVTISKNPLLASIHWSKLQVVRGGLSISQNPKLASPLGMDALQAVGKDLTISGNDALTDLSGLTSLTDTASLLISLNGGLTSVAELSKLATVRGSLTIRQNDGLTKVDGFAALRAVDWSVFLGVSAKLATIEGFAALVDVGGGLAIQGLPELVSVNAFNGLRQLGACVENATPVPYQNPSLWCGSVLTADSSPSHPAYTQYSDPASVVVRDNPKLQTIDGFGALTDLTNYSGAALSYGGMFGYAYLENNPALETLSWPLQKARSVEVAGSPLLTTLSLLNSWQEGLLTLDGIPGTSLSMPGLSGGSVTVRNTNALTELELPNVVTADELSLENNSALTTLDVPKLTTLSYLYLSKNAVLASLSRLSALTSVDNVVVTNNPKLAQCEATALATAVNASATQISGNDTVQTCP